MHVVILAEIFLFMLCPNEPHCGVNIDKHLDISPALVIYIVALCYCIQRPFTVNFSVFKYWNVKVTCFWFNFLENMDIEVSLQL